MACHCNYFNVDCNIDEMTGQKIETSVFVFLVKYNFYINNEYINNDSEEYLACALSPLTDYSNLIISLIIYSVRGCRLSDSHNIILSRHYLIEGAILI